MQHATRRIVSLAAVITAIAACDDAPTAPYTAPPTDAPADDCAGSPDALARDGDARFLILPCSGPDSDPLGLTLDAAPDAAGIVSTPAAS